MGIRIKLVVGLLSLVLLPLIGSQAWMNWRLDRGYGAAELTHAQQGLERLLVAIDAQLQIHETLVNDWANWTDFYDHVQGRQPNFASNNLTSEAIEGAHYNWLAVLTLDGRLLHNVSISSTQVQDWLSSVHGPQLKRLPQPGERNCGLIRHAGQWQTLCRQGIRPSSGVGEPAALLLVSETLRPDFERHLRALTGLEFVFSEQPLPGLPESQTGAALSSALGTATPALVLEEDHIQVWWPMKDMSGQAVGHLRLDWPRTLALQARDDLYRVQWQLAGFFLLITIGLLVLLDRLVVRRLQHFANELRAIYQQKRWQARVAVNGSDEIAELQRESNHLLDHIDQQMTRLEELADSDALTGLANRRRFQRELDRALATAARHGRPLCLAVLDVDHFKRYNDHYGHVQGDIALKTVARRLLTQSKRAGDLPARMGGEEFAMLLEDTDLQRAQDWAQLLTARLRDDNITHPRSPVSDRLTISIGLAQLGPLESSDRLYRRADEALYQAKAKGRNQVVAAGPPN